MIWTKHTSTGDKMFVGNGDLDSRNLNNIRNNHQEGLLQQFFTFCPVSYFLSM